MHRHARQLAAALAISAMTVPSANAEILLTKSRTSSYSVPVGPSVAIPLDEKGNFELDFETTKKAIVAIVYNAECAATGVPEGWIGLQIWVDSKLASPKAGVDDFALCSTTGGTEIYTAVSRQAFVKLDAGTHTVRVLVSRQGIDSGRLDDTSIVIKD